MEINGNRYDATTGQVVGAVNRGAKQLKNSATGVMDGFIRPKGVVSQPHRQVARTVKHTAQTVHKTTQRSRTLMRTAVKKPQLARHQVQVHNPQIEAVVATPHPKPQTAKGVAKHSSVERFGHITAPPKKTVQKVIATPMQPRLHSSEQKSTAPPMPSMTASASHKHLERMLDEALTTADSHHQTLHRKSRSHRIWRKVKSMPKLLTFGGGLIILASLSSLILWQKVPQVAVRVAAARANVDAAIPRYAPSGFAFSAPVQYSHGSVSVKYNSKNTTSHKYVLTQQLSNWDSSSLASSIMSKNTQVQTSEINGTTVYIYGDHNDASWVNHGVRYTLTDYANLSTDEILKIANSL